MMLSSETAYEVRSLTEIAPRTRLGQRAADLTYTRILSREGYELRGTNVQTLGLVPWGVSAVPGVPPVVVIAAPPVEAASASSVAAKSVAPMKTLSISNRHQPAARFGGAPFAFS